MNIREIGLYLKIRGEIDPFTLKLIEETYPVAEEAPLYYKTAEFSMERTEDGFRLLGADIELKGRLATRHFASCKKLIVILATLGMESERKERETFAVSPSKGVVLDACYSELLERRLDKIEEELKSGGRKLTTRISCGYGDLALETQRPLLDVLDGRRMGVYMNESCMLVPNKSVVALVGVVEED